MRNQPKPLNQTERFVQDRATEALKPFSGTDALVEVRYTKRNGDTSSSTGKVAFFNGIPGMDTGSVTIEDVTKGNRTINLHRITEYRVVRGA